MLSTYRTTTEALQIDGRFAGDLASAVENLRDYMADCGPDEFPDQAPRVAALRALATFLRGHEDAGHGMVIEAQVEGGTGVFIDEPAYR